MTYDNIYKYDAEADQWTPFGNMKTKRYIHAVSVVSKDKVLQNCLTLQKSVEMK